MAEREATTNGNGSSRVEEIRGKVRPALARAFGDSEMTKVLAEGIMGGFEVLASVVNSARKDSEAARGAATRAESALDKANKNAEQAAADAGTAAGACTAIRSDFDRVSQAAGAAAELQEVLTTTVPVEKEGKVVEEPSGVKQTLAYLLDTVKGLKATFSIDEKVVKRGGDALQYVADQLKQLSDRMDGLRDAVEKVETQKPKTEVSDTETRVAKLEADLREAKYNVAQILTLLEGKEPSEEEKQNDPKNLEQRLSSIESGHKELVSNTRDILAILESQEGVD